MSGLETPTKLTEKSLLHQRGQGQEQLSGERRVKAEHCDHQNDCDVRSYVITMEGEGSRD